MEKYDLYKDIALRTNGDIYIGVVGPVRTGKSTFITKFMQEFVIPNINNKLQKQIATDEMPQSADGKIVMTTQPKFVPANSVKVQFKNKVTANVRLVDCVGYMIKGAIASEDDKKRMVKTPWDNKEIPFEIAAEIGTQKVISEYSTIGIMVTTDASFSEIDRENYLIAEEKTISELKSCGKPFVIVLNSNKPNDKSTLELADKLENKFGVCVIPTDVKNMTSEQITSIFEKVLLEFPMSYFNVEIPKWMQVLPESSSIISDVISKIKTSSENISKMKDYNELNDLFYQDENFNQMQLEELNLSNGVGSYKLTAKEGLFYKAISSECKEEIFDDFSLMNYIKTFSQHKRKFEKIKEALNLAENDGYGIVLPTIEEMNLEEPLLVKQGGKYGVKLKATAPSLHIMKVDVSTEVSPFVGTEKQGEDLVNFIMNKFQDNPSAIWQTDLFGKSLHDLVNEGLMSKINYMPKEVQGKMRKTITRIVNENKGGVICILL